MRRREPRASTSPSAVRVKLPLMRYPPIATAVFSALAAGCAVQHYEPAPLDSEAAAGAFESRTLADPGLAAFEASSLGTGAAPPAEWDLRALSLAALYFNPQLDEARAAVAEAHAAVITAGARPNPTLSVSPGVPSPYLLSVDLSFPLETAGKRGYRIEAAQSLERASRLELAEAAWTVRGAVRAALIDYLVSRQALELARADANVRETQVEFLERMWKAGESRRLEVDAARAELLQAHSALRSAEEQDSEANGKLAAAIGVPPAALREVRISWPEMAAPPAAESLPLADIRREAVINRLDVRGALAEYAAAEAELKLEIAKQYPDVDIGPGYSYEERQSYFTLGLSTTLPMWNRNQGPIAEADARRRKSAAQFLEIQSQALSRSAQALAVYAVTLDGLKEAERLADLAEERRHAADESVRLGEADRLELIEAKVQYSIAARARLDAVAHAQQALGALEQAVERPLAPGEDFPTVDLDASRAAGR
jgi:outer membrane protein, heavy metal efflux system